MVLGSTRVGKSAIVNRFLNNTFDPVHRPNVDSCYRKVYRIKGETYCLEILDTSSVTQNPALRRVPLVTGKKRVFLGVSVIGYLHTYSADVRTCTSRYMYIHAHTIIVYKKNIYSMHGLRKDASYIRSVWRPFQICDVLISKHTPGLAVMSDFRHRHAYNVKGRREIDVWIARVCATIFDL